MNTNFQYVIFKLSDTFIVHYFRRFTALFWVQKVIFVTCVAHDVQ